MMTDIGRHKKEELYCPFCESDYTYIREEKLSVPLIGGDTYFYVFCEDCDARGPREFTKEKAVNKWNNRIK